MTGEPGGQRGGRSRRLRNIQRRAVGVAADQADMQDNVCGIAFAHNPARLRSPTDRNTLLLLLPEGALPSHRVFPVRNDVGAAVRHDVVVVLSIGGKDLGGTGHLRLENVEQKACSLQPGKIKERGRCECLGGRKVPHLRGCFLLSAYSSQISGRMTLLRPAPRD